MLTSLSPVVSAQLWGYIQHNNKQNPAAGPQLQIYLIQADSAT